MTKLEQVIQQFRNEIGAEFVSTDVVGLDGLSIAGMSADPEIDSSAIAARFALAIKMASNVSEKLGIGGFEENLTTTDKYISISRFLGDGSFFWVVTLNKEATLGMVRLLMNEYAPQIWDAIPR